MTEFLTGLKVIDLSLWQPGHVATQLLADLGADILKVEPPGGDRERAMSDRVANYYGHKRSLVLDLKQEKDRSRLHKLVAQADVVVEGYRPGVAARLGAGYEQLSAVNPALVYCSISGFGQIGPLAQSTGHEHNYLAYAGGYVTTESGTRPVAPGALIGDQGAGMASAFAILAAVLCARRTGQGDHIDVSIADLLMSWVAPMGTIGDAAPEVFGEPAGLGLYPTGGGGYVVLGIFTEDHFWRVLCQTIGLAHYAGFRIKERMAQAAELRAAIEAYFGTRTRDELVAELAPLAIPIAPVLSRAEAMEHPHFRARQVITQGSDEGRRVGHPIRYRHHPARPPGNPPAVGEDGDRGFEET